MGTIIPGGDQEWSNQTGQGVVTDTLYSYNTYYCTALRGSRDEAVSINRTQWRGEETPHYQRARKKGTLIPYTNWSHLEETGECSGGFNYTLPTTACTGGKTRVYSEGGNYWWMSGWAGLSQEDISWLDDNSGGLDAFVQQACGNCYARGADALTFLVELKKLGPDVVRFARRAKQAYGDITQKVKDLGKVDPQTGAAEATFGWGSLGHDLVNLYKAAQAISEEERKFTTSRVGDSVSEVTSKSVTYANDGYKTVTGVETTSRDLSLRGSCCALFTPSQFRFNPIATGWEVLPWSWLVDYLIDIGSWIEAMSLEALAESYTAASGLRYGVVRQVPSVEVAWKSGASGTVYGSMLYSAVLIRRVRVSPPKYPQRGSGLNVFKLQVLLDILASKGGGHH
jgi:hypothetical protein